MEEKIKSCDIGSLPFEWDFRRFLKDPEYFQQRVTESFVDKLRMGIDIPTYPQFRDMNEMFIEMMGGVEKKDDAYHMVGRPSLRYTSIPEIGALRKKAKSIAEMVGGPIQAGVCITGPYTLSSLFMEKSPDIFDSLGSVIKEITKNNIFREKDLEIKLFTLDEPTFGLIDDARIDKGSEGRESLAKAWEDIFHSAKRKGADTHIHLHSTTDQLFLEVGSLSVIGSSVNDVFYSSKSTKEILEQYDKFLNVSVCRTNFDDLIRAGTRQPGGGDVAEIWSMIRNGRLDPIDFLEDVASLSERLKSIVGLVGAERVKYASPECGLEAFPSYECALTCLYRVSQAVKMLNFS